MPSNIVGANRSNALWRILGLIYLLTLWPIVAAIGFIAALIFMVVDVVLQLVFNSAGWSESGMLGGLAVRLYKWPLAQAKWILLGTGMFPFLP